MGYIEETGAAQYYRDARILPIYEGTTAIQANDFIGRKTLRDGGEVSRGFIAAMCDTVNALNQHQDDAALAFIGAQLEIAVQAYQNALDATLEFAGKGNMRSAFAGSVPFLMLAGYVHAGWHLANAALKSRAGTSDIGRQKIATAAFYAAHLLPKSLALSSAVKAGDQVQEAFSAVFS